MAQESEKGYNILYIKYYMHAVIIIIMNHDAFKFLKSKFLTDLEYRPFIF